ncbi:sperm flagellar protein 1 isoform 2-T3 [Sarcophilus harrisii]
MAGGVDEEILHQLYLWVDNIPLSRPKRNLSRDFSDGVLAAEVVKFYFPKMVEMHNYVPANSVQQKINNWIHLNRKVLHKLNFSVPEDVIQKIAQCSPGVVELVLIPLRQRLEEKKQKMQGLAHLRSSASRKAVTTWTWVSPRSPVGMVPRTPGKQGSSGEASTARPCKGNRASLCRSPRRSKNCWHPRRQSRSFR